MGHGGVQAIELVFLLLLLFVIAFGELARRLQIPYPIVLVIAGALLGLVPGIPRIALNPDTIFFVIFLPCFIRRRGPRRGASSRAILSTSWCWR